MDPPETRPVLIMGILNLTPDSFYDGGKHPSPERAVETALRMEEEGADWIDIGGESTRPGAAQVPVEEEKARVLPVLRLLAGRVSVPLSIDTSKPEVARAALAEGASILNDVRGFGDPAMVRIAAQSAATVVVMHMQGDPVSMQSAPGYTDVVGQIKTFLGERSDRLVAAGVSPGRIFLDPGIGFGKRVEHNVRLLREIASFSELGYPLLVGPSRKSFLTQVAGGADPKDRLPGTLASVAWLALQGVRVVRVHDVSETVQVLRLIEAMRSGVGVA